METVWADLAYGIRILLKNRAFTVIAVMTLALGIGANTALFSVVNGVLLNPLPYPHPERLVSVYQKTAEFAQASVPYANFLDWQRDNRSFQSLAGYVSEDFNLTGNGEAERILGEMTSAAFFQMLGVQPVMGRTFTADEDRVGGPPVVLISTGFWHRKFGSPPDIVGKRITLNGVGHTIIGVFPSGHYLDRHRDLYVPIGQWNDPTFRDRRTAMGMQVLGRLAPGVSFEQARAGMEQIARNLATAYPEANTGKSVALVRLKEDMVGYIQPYLLVLFGAVGFVLLIACANVANLLLARSSGRVHEFAVRAALGASRARVIRQLLTESILLAVAGGGVGLLLAAWGTRTVLAALPGTLPRNEEIGLDTHVLVFTLGISLLAAVLFGLAPAFKTSHIRLQETLRESGRILSGARQRVQSVLVVIEMALALVLLVGAGLMVRSLSQLWSINPGFNPRNALTFGVSLAPSLGSNPDAIRAAWSALREKVKAIPGVEAVSAGGGSLPMMGDSELPFWLEGQPMPATDAEKKLSLFYLCEPDYLKVLGVPLRRGRFFTPHDGVHTPFVAVIDEAFARQYFPNTDPVGKRLNVVYMGKVEIVGVTGHVKHWGLDSDAKHAIQAQMYLPVLQIPDKFMPLVARGMQMVIRSTRSPLALVPAIRQAVRQLNGEQVMYSPRTLDSIVSESLAAQRFSMILLALFAALAVVLSSVGIYGVLSNVVGQRTREIGIRIALGAEQNQVLGSILAQGIKMTLIGVAIGVAAALALTRLMSNMLYGVDASDPLTFAGVAVLLVLVAFAACYIPARRAVQVDPIVALRYE